MLQDSEEIDMVANPEPHIVMLIVNDFTPWSDADANERLELYRAKIDRYARYAGSKQLRKDYPAVRLVVISTLTVTAPSKRMLDIKSVKAGGKDPFDIPVICASDPNPEATRAQQVQMLEAQSGDKAPSRASARPWWRFW